MVFIISYSDQNVKYKSRMSTWNKIYDSSLIDYDNLLNTRNCDTLSRSLSHFFLSVPQKIARKWKVKSINRLDKKINISLIST